MKAFEALVVSEGLNLSAVSLLHPRTHLVDAKGSPPNVHMSIMIEEGPVTAWVIPALLRVIRNVTSA
jgi:hypothetical protein